MTSETIRLVHEASGCLLDPHTAVAMRAAQGMAGATPTVVLGTAHPAKFPDAVAAATGHRPQLPAQLADLLERPERVTVLENDLATVQSFIDDSLG